jgi:uncharacterized membrane protein YcaP (DUF421 family)
MGSIGRALFMYLFLLFVIRIAGNRTMSEMTTFDFILLLIVGDSTQQAITSNDYSITNAVIIILTFVVLNIIIAYLKNKFALFDRVIEGSPLIVVNQGKPLEKIMHKAKINDADILEAARKAHGLERMQQIKYAILEKDGDITIVPKQ